MAKRRANGEGNLRKRKDGPWEGRYTVGKWMEVWFEHYAKVKVRPSSHQTYRGYIDNHIKPNIGKIPLEKLTSLDLQKFYKKLLASGRVGRIESGKQSKAPPAGRSPRTACCTCSTGC